MSRWMSAMIESAKERGRIPSEIAKKYEEGARPDVPHYQGKIEVIDFINAHDLNFNRGNVIKYTVRAGKKDPAKEIEDLKKAIHYLQFEIERIIQYEK